MGAGQVLVIAPDEDMRRSIAFALTAYGHDVASMPTQPAVETARNYACTVIDEAALPASDTDLRSFCIAFAPVLLLAYESQARALPHVSAVLDKPLHGEAVVHAVVAAIALHSAATTK